MHRNFRVPFEMIFEPVSNSLFYSSEGYYSPDKAFVPCMLTIVNWHYYWEPSMLCAFPHRQSCVKTENSALARVNLILLYVWNIHTAIEKKHLEW